MLNRQLYFGLPLVCVLATCASSSIARLAPEATTQPKMHCRPLETAAITLHINGTQRVSVEPSEATTTANGCTWTGIVRETGESAILMWWRDGRLTGMLGFKGHIYTVTKVGEEIHAAREVGPRVTAPVPARADSGDKGAVTPVREKTKMWPALATPALPAIEPFSDAAREALEAKKITIDVMMLYTKKAASHYIRDPADVIALAVEQTNQTFRNSGLGNISLRLVHTELLDYDETGGDHFAHLYRMVDGIGPLKAIHKLRNEKRADIVGLILDDPSGCGLSTRVGADAEEAYFVAHHSCAAITYSIAHEIGHILGARHDRQIDASNSPFPFGHGYANGNKWRDVMSYQESCDGCPRIPHWSNPRVTYKGEPTGTAANDNARVILTQAERVSNFR